MSRYLVEDTHTGFRISLVDQKSGAVRKEFNEPGGHGPVERLFQQAEWAWEEMRAKEMADRVHRD